MAYILVMKKRNLIIKMRLFNNIKKKGSSIKDVFNKKQIINEILDGKIINCPEWKFFRISNDDDIFDKINCDFIAIYTDVINKEIRLKSNPFSEYKRTVESVYQIVRQIYITDQNVDVEFNEFYKNITATSAKELFIKLKNEVL